MGKLFHISRVEWKSTGKRQIGLATGNSRPDKQGYSINVLYDLSGSGDQPPEAGVFF